MRILFTSDLHGYEPAYHHFARLLGEGGFDCGIIAGDLVNHFTRHETDAILRRAGLTQRDLILEGSPEQIRSRRKLRKSTFAKAHLARAERMQSMICEHGVPVFFIMGNDDGIVAGGYEWSSTDLMRNVNQRRIEFLEWNFVGYQYTNPFVGGIFEKSEPEQRNDLDHLLPLVDERTILVTHGPPRGILDSHGFGSSALREFVDHCNPTLHLFGHIHQAAAIRWPFINGAFPEVRRFLCVDVGGKSAEYLEPPVPYPSSRIMRLPNRSTRTWQSLPPAR